MLSEEHSISLDPNSLDQQRRHAYLLASVAPRPIAFASTIDKKGNVNLSPFSFFNVFSSNPPIMVFSPSRRGRDSTQKDTYNNIKEIPEVVINIVTYDIVEKVSLASTEYESGVDEFIKAGLTPVDSETIKPPRALEAPMSFECKVNDVISLGEKGGAGNLIIAEVQRMHFKESYLKEDGLPDTTKLDLVGRMGENWYIRASEASLFEIPKPLSMRGIGVDQLSQSIRNSNILTANNIGRLGNVKYLPSEATIFHHKESVEVKEIFLEHENQRDMIKDGLHHLGKQYLEKDDPDTALAILMIVDMI